MQDELAEVLVVLFDSKHRLAPFLATILNTEVRTAYMYMCIYIYIYIYIVRGPYMPVWALQLICWKLPKGFIHASKQYTILY